MNTPTPNAKPPLAVERYKGFQLVQQSATYALAIRKGSVRFTGKTLSDIRTQIDEVL